MCDVLLAACAQVAKGADQYRAALAALHPTYKLGNVLGAQLECGVRRDGDIAVACPRKGVLGQAAHGLAAWVKDFDERGLF